ncbi:MAG: hypothetical protein AMXMBFR64_56930 [Myxococcales bacterium]
MSASTTRAAGVRLALAAGGIVLLASSLLALWSRSLLVERLVGSAHAHIRTVARGFATAHADAILTGDTRRIEPALARTLTTEEGVQWIAVVGNGGEILATGPGPLSHAVRDAIRTTPTLGGPFTTAIRGADETSYDVAVPIIPSLRAAVHVGVGERWLTQPLLEADLVMAGATALIAALAALLAWAFGRRLGRPTEILVQAAQRVGSGEADARVPASTGDPHMDLVARAMDQMRRDMEHHQAAAASASRRAASAEKLAAMGTLVAGIAHQVNNPLAGVQSCLEMAREAPEGERRAYLDLAEEGVGRLAEVMRRLTEYARTGLSGPRPTDVNEVVRHALAFCRTWDRVSDPEPVVELGMDLPVIQGEPDALSDVIVNLYTNGRLAAPGSPVHVESRLGRDGVVVAVRDHGPGVSLENRLRVFEPFYTTRAQGKGTGLGLALCDAIVRRHGGEIVIDDAPGGGAVFAVWLPVDHPNAEVSP